MTVTLGCTGHALPRGCDGTPAAIHAGMSFLHSILAVALLAGCSKAAPAAGAGSNVPKPGADPAPAGPRLRALTGVDLAGSFTVKLGAATGTVKLVKSSGDRYLGSAVIGGKKLAVLAHREGNSLAGVLKPFNVGTWIGHYKVFCDRALEGAIAETEDETIGSELLAATSDTLDGETKIRIGTNFHGRFKGTLKLQPVGEALQGTYARSDDYSGRAIAVRLGDTLAVGYAFGEETFYVFDVMIDDSTAGALVGKAATRPSQAPATTVDMTWGRVVAANATHVAATGGSTATFASGGACIEAPASGHAMEKLVAKPSSGGGGGAPKGEDCSRLVGHWATCGYSTCQVDLDNDTSNCGACGTSCSGDTWCLHGACVPH